MYNLVKRYMDNLTKEQVMNFAQKNQIFLSQEELDFTYTFVKKNWEMIFRNPNLLNVIKTNSLKKTLSKFKNYLSFTIKNMVIYCNKKQ